MRLWNVDLQRLLFLLIRVICFKSAAWMISSADGWVTRASSQRQKRNWTTCSDFSCHTQSGNQTWTDFLLLPFLSARASETLLSQSGQPACCPSSAAAAPGSQTHKEEESVNTQRKKQTQTATETCPDD